MLREMDMEGCHDSDTVTHKLMLQEMDMGGCHDSDTVTHKLMLQEMDMDGSPDTGASMACDTDIDSRSIVVSYLNPSTTDECVKYFLENPWRSGGGPVEMVLRLDDTTALVRFLEQQDAASVLKKAQLKLDGYVLTACAPVRPSYLEPECGKSGTSQADGSGSVSSPSFSITSAADQRAEASRSLTVINTDSQSAAASMEEVCTRKETLLNLTLCQLKLLTQPQVLAHIGRSCPAGVEVCVDTKAELAQVKAPENSLEQACAHVHSFLSGLGEVTLQLSPALSRMYGPSEHRAWVQRTMLDPLDLPCHWELQGQALVVCAQQSKLPFLKQLFRSLFVEVKLPLEHRELGVLVKEREEGWLNRLQEEVSSYKDGGGGGPSPVLVVDERCVTIVDIPARLMHTQALLTSFLEQHREPSKGTSSGARVVEKPLASAGDPCNWDPTPQASTSPQSSRSQDQPPTSILPQCSSISQDQTSPTSTYAEDSGSHDPTIPAGRLSSQAQAQAVQCCAQQQRVVEQVVPYLKPSQLSVVSVPHTVANLCRKHPGLKVRVDRDRGAVLVQAPEDIMQEAFRYVLAYITNIQDSTQMLTPALACMYQRDSTRAWIQRRFIDMFELPCHWDVDPDSLTMTISGHSDNLKRLTKIFQFLFTEVKVDVVDPAQVTALTLTPSALQSVGDALKEGREDDGPTPVLMLEGACVTIVDVPSKINTSMQALQQFLLKEQGSHQVSSSNGHEEVSNKMKKKTLQGLNPGQARVLAHPELVHRLVKNCPELQVTVCPDDHSSSKTTAQLTAPDSVADKAFADLQTAIEDVRELRVKLTPGLCRMFRKEESRQWIQASLVDRFDLACHWELQRGDDGDERPLVISAPAPRLFRLEQLFRAVFREAKVNLKEREVEELTPPVWRGYVADQGRDRAGSGLPSPVLELDVDGQCVTIVDVPAKVDHTRLNLVQLLSDLAPAE